MNQMGRSERWRRGRRRWLIISVQILKEDKRCSNLSNFWNSQKRVKRWSNMSTFISLCLSWSLYHYALFTIHFLVFETREPLYAFKTQSHSSVEAIQDKTPFSLILKASNSRLTPEIELHFPYPILWWYHFHIPSWTF